MKRGEFTNLSTLFAANSSPIATYGTRLVSVDLGLRRKMTWLCTVAEVSHNIIGADFLHFGLPTWTSGIRESGTARPKLLPLAKCRRCELTKCVCRGVKTVVHKYDELLSEFADITSNQIQSR